VNAKRLLSIGLVSILWLGSGGRLTAQSNWPTAPKPAAEKPASEAKSKPAASRPTKRRTSRKSSTARVDQVTLRTISDLLARQTLAIEALTLQLEAVERRGDNTRPSEPELTSDISNACRPPRAGDWARLHEPVR
jgi:hypothetical protein